MMIILILTMIYFKEVFCLQFYLIYINDLIKNLDYIDFEILAYADDPCVLCQDKNELIRVIKRIDLWSKENDINVNRKKKRNICSKRWRTKW